MSKYTCDKCFKSFKSSKRFRDHNCMSSDRRSVMSTQSSVRSTSSRSEMQQVQTYYESKLTELNQEYQKVLNSNREFQARINEQDTQSDSKLQRLKTMYKKDTIDLETENQQLRKQIRDLTTQQVLVATDDIENQYKHQIAQKETEIARLKIMIDERDNEVKTLQQNSTTLVKKKETSLVSKYEKQLSELKEKYEIDINDLKKQNTHIRTTYETQFTKEKNSLESQFKVQASELKTQYETEIKPIKLQLTKLENEKKSIENTLTEQVKTLNQQLIQSKENYKQAREEIDALKDIHSRNEEKLKKSSESILKSQQEKIHNLERTNDEQLRKIKESLQDINVITKERNDLQQKYDLDISKLESRIHRLNMDYEASRSKFKEREKEIDTTYQDKVKEQSTLIENYEKRMEEFKTLQASSKRQNEQYTALKKQYSELNELYRETEKKCKFEKTRFTEMSTTYAHQLEETKKLDVKCSSLTKQFESAKKQNLELNEKLEKSFVNVSDWEVKHNKLQRQHERLLENMQHTLTDEKKLSEMLQKEIVSLKSKCEDRERLQHLSESLQSELGKTRDKLSLVITNNDKNTGKIQELQKTIQELNQNINSREEEKQKNLVTLQSYETKLSNLRNEFDNLQKRGIEVEKERDNIQAKYFQVSKERDEFSEHFIKQKDKIIELETVNTRIVVDRDNFRLRFGELKGVNDMLGNSMQTLKKELKEEKEKFTDLHSRYTSIAKHNNELKTQFDNETKSLTTKIQDLIDERKQLQDKLNNIRSHVADYNVLQTELTTTKDTINHQKMTIYQLEQDNAQYKSRYTQQENDFNQILKEMKKKLDDKDKVLEDQTNEIIKLKEIEPKVQELHKNLNFYKQEYSKLEELQKKYDIRSQEFTSLRQEHSKLTHDLNELQKNFDNAIEQISQYKIKTRNSEEFKKKYEEYLSKSKELAQLNHKLENKLSSQENVLGQLRAENQIKTKGLEDNLKRVAQLDRELAEKEQTWVKRFEQTTLTNHKLQNELNFANGQISTIQDNTEELKKAKIENDKLNNMVNKTKQINDELKKQVSSRDNTIETVKQDVVKLTKANNELKQTIKLENDRYHDTKKTADMIIARNEETINNLNRQVNDLAEFKKSSEERIKNFRSIESQLEESKKETYDITLKYQQLKKTNHTLTGQFRDLTDNYEKVKNEYKDYLVLQKDFADLTIRYNKMDSEFKKTEQAYQILKANTDASILETNEKQKRDIEGLNRRVTSLVEENRNLLNEVGALNTLKDEKRKLEKENSEQKRHIKEIQTINRSFEAKLRALPSQHEYSKIEQHRNSLINENEEVKSELTKLHRQLHHLPKTEAQLKTLQTSIENANKRIVQQNEEIQKFKNTDIENRQLVTQLRDEMVRTREIIKPLEEQIEVQKKEISQLRVKPAQFEQRLKKVRDDSLTTIHKYINQRKQIEGQLQNAHDEIEKLKLNIQVFVNEAEQHREEMRNLHEVKDELKENYLQNLNEQKQDNDSKLEDLRKQLELRNLRVSELEGMLSKFVSKTLTT